jgi:hypothetical protein
VREVELARGDRVRVHHEAVVLARDLDDAGATVDHRMVRAAVPELELARARTEREPEQLVSEADAERGQLLRQLAGGLDREVERLGVTGAVREQHAVGRECQHVRRGGTRRHDAHAEAFRPEPAEDVVLDAVIAHDDERLSVLGGRLDRGRTGRAPPVGLDAGDDVREREAFHLRARARLLHELVRVRALGRETAAHRALVAQVAGERARVDTGESGQVLLREQRIEGPGRAPVARDLAEIATHHALRPQARTLPVLVVHAVVADQRVREHQDLAAIGRVREDLLVPGHRGVEHDLAGGLDLGTETLAAEDASVLERQHRLAPLHRSTFAARHGSTFAALHASTFAALHASTFAALIVRSPPRPGARRRPTRRCA